jgi:hypothetical protein
VYIADARTVAVFVAVCLDLVHTPECTASLLLAWGCCYAWLVHHIAALESHILHSLEGRADSEQFSEGLLWPVTEWLEQNVLLMVVALRSPEEIELCSALGKALHIVADGVHHRPYHFFGARFRLPLR